MNPKIYVELVIFHIENMTDQLKAFAAECKDPDKYSAMSHDYNCLIILIKMMTTSKSINSLAELSFKNIRESAGYSKKEINDLLVSVSTEEGNKLLEKFPDLRFKKEKHKF